MFKFESLKTLDVEGNDLIHYFPVFSAPIKAGLDVRSVYFLAPPASSQPSTHLKRNKIFDPDLHSMIFLKLPIITNLAGITDRSI